MSATDLRRTNALRRRRCGVGIVALILVLWMAACGTSPSPAPTAAPVPTGTATARPTPVTSADEACVTTTMAKMTLPQLVGQVMMVGTPATDTTKVNELIRNQGVGGVFLAGRSRQSAGALRTAITALQAAAPPGVGLLVALDQEGGEVQTLQGTDFPAIPTAVAQGRLAQSTLEAQTVAWAKRLAEIGVTMDLAPVADTVPTSIGTKNPPIGGYARQYGSDPTAVAADITTVVTAIQSTGIVTTIKHFPGLGRVLKNTDTSTGAVDTVATTQDPFLAPFTAGIQAGTGAVMISSASYPNLDPNAIAAFSPAIVTGLLREQLGFQGLVVSDDLGAAVAASAVPVGQRAVKFLAAGGDLTLTVSPATAVPMINGLLAAANASPTFTAQITAAARSVIRTKYGAGLLACSPASTKR